MRCVVDRTRFLDVDGFLCSEPISFEELPSTSFLGDMFECTEGTRSERNIERYVDSARKTRLSWDKTNELAHRSMTWATTAHETSEVVLAQHVDAQAPPKSQPPTPAPRCDAALVVNPELELSAPKCHGASAPRLEYWAHRRCAHVGPTCRSWEVMWSISARSTSGTGRRTFSSTVR